MIQAVKAKKVITGTEAQPIDEGIILIENNRILKVDEGRNVKIPESCTVHALENEIVIPGFVDAHSHSAPTPGQGAKKDDPQWRLLFSAARNIRKDLKQGVTTIRTLGDIDLIDVWLKQAVEDGLLPGPRMCISGKAIKSKTLAGLWSIAIDANGEKEIRKSIRENIEAGADWVKIFVSGHIMEGDREESFYSKEEIWSAVDEAHRLGKPISAHACGGKAVRHCLETGVDTIEHGGLLDDDDIELFLKKGAWLIPTFNPLFGDIVLENITDKKKFEDVKRTRKQFEESFRKAYKAGVKCAMGTDGRHGALAFEMECWVKFGGSGMEAILAGTRDSAKAIRMGEEVGTLEPGKRADLISVRGDPLKDILEMRNIGMVMKDGKRYEAISLE